ncbi:MAG TPA: hypothetical protein VJR50_12825 [Mycobacterium sp.]|jgi:hypothetical protein|nr:hypothetical protein [Mycobacterium sp.]
MSVRRLVAALGIFAVVATGLGAAIAMIAAPKPPPAPPPSTFAAPTPKVPTPAEFQIGIVVTDQKCVGPDACVYKYRVEPKYLGLHPLPDKEVKVFYQVRGGHQPQDGDFTVAGGQARVLQDVPLEGPPGARLTAAVTKVVG